MSILPATASAYQNAISKAQRLGGSKIVTKIRDGLYIANGSNTTYAVEVIGDGEDFTCTCPGGERGIPCYHSAACWLDLVRERSRPAPVPELPEYLLDTDNRVLRPADGRYEVVGILIEGTPAHSAGCELYGPGLPNCPRCN